MSIVPLLAMVATLAGGAVSIPDPAGPAAPAGAGLVIIAPRPIEIVSGQQAIEVAVPSPGPDGDAVVEIQVDGKAVGRLEHPPYKLAYDFGTALSARTITVRIVSGTGSGLVATITTRGFDLRKVDQVARVDLVNLWISVRDGSGRYVTGLPKEAFRVLEGNVPQTIEHFSVEPRPLAAAIVLDTSFSMKGEPIAAAREAATRFVKSLAPDDRAMVISFSDAPQVIATMTTDRTVLSAAIGSVEAKGGTALYDAIWRAADTLSVEEGRKIIVLLSDGRDEAQSGVEPGSLHTFEEALDRALRSEAIIFTIGFGKKLGEELDFYGRVSLKEILDRLAMDTGGTSHYPQRPGQLKGAYDMISEELRRQYNLAYAPQDMRADGAWRPIRIVLSDTTLKAYTRRGYYAPKG